MIVIRREVVTALECSAAQEYDRHVLQHLKEFAPRLARTAGDHGLQQIVLLGAQRCDQIGFTNRAAVQLFCESMCSLGAYFDGDPQYRWLTVILANRERDQMLRANDLYDAIRSYFDYVAGPDNGLAVEALRRVLSADLTKINRAGHLELDALGAMRKFYPEKCEYVGERALRELIDTGTAFARQLQISSSQGTLTLVGLMFGFGHGVFLDPLYPWIGSTLGDERLGNPEERVRRLQQKTMIYVEHMLRHLAIKK